MDKWIPEYNRRVIRKHRFGFSPSYKVSINNRLKSTASIFLAVKVIESLNWDLEYSDHETAIAVRINSAGTKTHRICINAKTAFLEIESRSLNGNFWDMGNNSKRVQYFVFAYEGEVGKLNSNQIDEIEKKVIRDQKWADYTIPESLPSPSVMVEAKPLYFVLTSILIAISSGLIFAFFLSKGIYLIPLMEVLAGLGIGYASGFFAGKFHFTESESLKKIFVWTVLVFFFANIFFQFVFISFNKPLLSISFIEYLELRLDGGLKIGKMNLGWVGIVISWVLQLIIPYYIGILRLVKASLLYRINRVPQDVIDFTYYHFLNGKSEDGVRKELSKKGWCKKVNQDEALSALNALFEYKEMTKIHLKN